MHWYYQYTLIESEKSLSQSIARGVNTRILPINCFKASAKYDIKEVKSHGYRWSTK